MRTIKIGGGVFYASAISLGCMRISGMGRTGVCNLIETALDEGINFFDHADIYGGGQSESVFGEAIKAAGIARNRLMVQTKCAIHDGYYDFSKEYILTSVENSLKRLNMDYADVLLLHRPDTLMEPEEVAEAFARLHQSGKVLYFGVSNHSPGQMRLLQKYLGQRLCINQAQFSVAHSGIIDAGLNVNMKNQLSVDHDGGLLEYCRLENITIQAWSPFQHGFFDGPFIDDGRFPALNKTLGELAETHHVTKEAIAIAWILRHPAHIQPIIGTTRTERIRSVCEACDVELTRAEWYALYRAAGNELP